MKKSMKRQLSSEDHNVKRRCLDYFPFTLEITEYPKPIIRCRLDEVSEETETIIIGNGIYQVANLPKTIKSPITLYVSHQIYFSIHPYYTSSTTVEKKKAYYAQRFSGKINDVKSIELVVSCEQGASKRCLDVNIVRTAIRNTIQGTIINLNQSFDFLPEHLCSATIVKIDGYDTTMAYGLIDVFTELHISSECPGLLLFNGVQNLKNIIVKIKKAEPYHQNVYPLSYPIQIFDIRHLRNEISGYLEKPFPINEIQKNKFSWSEFSFGESEISYKTEIPEVVKFGIYPPLYRITRSTQMHINYIELDNIIVIQGTDIAHSATIEVSLAGTFLPKDSDNDNQTIIDTTKITDLLVQKKIRMLLQGENRYLDRKREGIVLQMKKITVRMNLKDVHPKEDKKAYLFTPSTNFTFVLNENAYDKLILINKYRSKCRKITLKNLSDEIDELSLTDEIIREHLETTISVGQIITIKIGKMKCRVQVVKLSFLKSVETYKEYHDRERRIGIITKDTIINIKPSIKASFDIIPLKQPQTIDQIIAKLQTKIGGHRNYLDTIVNEVIIPRTVMVDEFRKRGFKPSCGIILYGPPGTGKTTLAKNIAKCLDIPSENIKMVCGSSLFVKWVGDSEKRVRELFSDAKEAWNRDGVNSPLYAIIIDEIDALLGNRDHSTTGVDRKVVNQFLSELDGLETNENMICFGTTNRLDIMDPAVLRSGRFGIKLEFKLPDAEARREILEIYLSKLRNIERLGVIDLNEIVRQTEGLSGADLEKIVSDASMISLKRMIAAIPDDKNEISCVEQADLLETIKKLKVIDTSLHQMYL
jgi:ATP-dependent 26S proteasome regulatory subunit